MPGQNPLENMLLLQYLSGAGSAMSVGEPVGPALNQVTQQQISSRNFMKMMQKMLGGQVPEGGKVTMDSKGTKLELPKTPSVLNSDFDPLDRGSSILPTGSNPVPPTMGPPATSLGGGLMSLLNPSASPLDISGADLAGLTPQDISQALQFKFGQEQFEQKKISDAADLLYKSALTQRALAPAAANPLDRPFVSNVPGYGNLTLRQYQSLPSKDREYISYVLASKQLGEEPMSKNDWGKTPDKDKVPTTAMGAAIASYYDENKQLPPPEVLQNWTEMFREGQQEKTLTPVNWSTATKELTKRFGRLDPTGMWAVTPELQSTHRRSQEILTELKDQGMDPLKAVNEAENRARKEYQGYEDRYFEYLNLANGDEDKIDRLKSQFYRKYGYIPTKRIY